MLRRFGDGEDRERGVTLLLVAASMVAFIGMAAFAVDLGWIYLQSTNVQKAAEASALAAVVHMPLLTPQAAGSVISSGIPAADAADAIAETHGYAATATIATRWAHPSQVRVDISSSTNTFFLAFFGIDTISLNRHAIAEQLPPLKMGSDGNRLGTDPGVTDEHYWLGVNGEQRRKQDGDPFSTRCNTANECGSDDNESHRSPAYYYAIDVPAADIGASITVQVYDGSTNTGGSDLPEDITGCSGFACFFNFGNNDAFEFRLIKPDATPGNPADNSSIPGSQICSRIFDDDDGNDAWLPVCTFTPASQGIHVLELIVDGYDDGINGFSLKVTGSSGTSVYGLGYMSLWMVDAGTNPTLNIVRLDELYAGTELIISAFDLGDINGTADADVTFGGALSSMSCEILVFGDDHDHDDADPISDLGTVSPCKLVTKAGNTGSNQGIYNNQWVEFLFKVDPTYTCSGSGCWGTVTYNFHGGDPVDRTTWGARINGTPVHLLDQNTPDS